jgi:uncharacterized membrane protein YozB (DUF420 family)
MNTVITKIAGSYTAICRKAYLFASRNSLAMMVVLGVGLLTAGLTEVTLALPGDDFNDDAIVQSAEAILGQFIEGSFGALLMIVAGLVAIIAAAMGAYRAAMACLVIAVGAFVLRSFVTRFFGDVVS